MSQEGQLCDRKSLRVLQGGDHGLRELACDCVAMSNVSAGVLDIGVKDDAILPLPEHWIDWLLTPVGEAGGRRVGLTLGR